MDLPAPMLATPGRLPTGGGWAYEFKWDGIRVMCAVSEGRWRLVTRRGTEAAARFPELASITGLGDVLLDGELTVFDGALPDFAAAVRRLRGTRPDALAETSPATVLVFDVLSREGVDLREHSYEQRRELLEELDLTGEHWTVPPRFGDGAATAAASREHGLEGVVAKRLASPYVSGRSRHWIKMRHSSVIDAVVVGWAPTPAGAVSLLLAERTPDGLAYRGRCPAPAEVSAALEPLAVRAPVLDVPEAPAGVRWARPELRVEVRAASRTPRGRLRHARLVRVRLDQLG